MLKVGLSLAMGFALGYLAMARSIAAAINRDPKGFKAIIEKHEQRAKERKEHRRKDLAEQYGAGYGIGARHQPFGLWNPTHPTDPGSR